MTRQRSRVRPHLLAPDAETPADQLGRQRCSTCGLMGRVDDVHHPSTVPVPKVRPMRPYLAEAARERDAAVLGERDD